MTYQDMKRHEQALNRFLLSLGVEPQDVVSVSIDRTNIKVRVVSRDENNQPAFYHDGGMMYPLTFVRVFSYG